MKEKSRAVLYVATLLSIACLRASPAVAQLTCEARAPKTEILPFEPIELALSVSNMTSEVVVAKENWISAGVLVARPQANEPDEWDWSCHGGWHAPGAGPPPPIPPLRYEEKTFSPHEVKQFAVISVFGSVSGDECLSLWRKPGRLAVRGTVGRFQSAPIVITVLEPKGADAEAATALKNGLIPYMFSEETRHGGTKAEAKLLQEFAEKYKGSVYADYATLGLGLMNLKGIRDEQEPNAERKQDLSAAESYFTTLSQKQGSVVKDRATFYLAVCRAKKGEKQAASEILQNLAAQSTDPIVRFKAAQRIPE